MNNLLDLVNISEEDDYILTGTSFMREKKLDKAIECFDAVIEKNNRNLDAYFNKGLCLFILKRFDEAKDLFKKCTLIDRKFGKAYMFLGDMAFFIDGKVELALENYNKAIINNFDEEPVHLSKAFIYLTMNDSLNALKSYNKALLKNPKSKKALLGKLELYFKQLRFKDAEECINKIREIDTECEEYYTWAPLILTAQGKDKEA
ncbi:MAG: tetratricopeptide repeat protein, partial [Romboutsia timonensis]|uniref:tetratricopeptide repeat protein n=1 Tax=Romboutsia timonensis TaxID=1776391 RepID=UPI002A74B200